jgi:hypothetical protein
MSAPFQITATEARMIARGDPLESCPHWMESLYREIEVAAGEHKTSLKNPLENIAMQPMTTEEVDTITKWLVRGGYNVIYKPFESIILEISWA